MPTIKLFTTINAPIQICFDLARDISTHQQSSIQTKEKAIAGKTNGLIEKGETVTWEAIHFGIKQKLTVQVTEMESPTFFKDVMLKGAFKSMEHTHSFEKQGKDITLMKDEFSYETPYGILGKFFNWLILEKHMTTFLVERNKYLKLSAEKNVS